MLGELRAGPALCHFLLRAKTDGLPAGDGRPVIVFPGFLAGDVLTLPLRSRLTQLGYHAVGWRFGTNLGLKPGLMAEMVHYVKSVHAGQKRPVTLIGWSLGGIYVREIAKRIPERIDQIITLGTPSGTDLRANNAWRLYERLNDHPANKPPLETDVAELPPRPLTAILASDDGIVNAAEVTEGPICQMLRVKSTHVGLAWNAEVLRIIADRLHQPMDAWKPYSA